MTKNINKYITYSLYALVSGFIFASGVILFTVVKKGGNIFEIQSAGKVNVLMLVIIWLITAAAMFAIFQIKKRLYRSVIPLSVFAFSVLTLWNIRSTMHYYGLVLSLAVILCVFVFKETFPDIKIAKLEGKPLYLIVLAMTIAATAILTVGSILRMYTFNSSTFDLGLFTQMYEFMATDFTQNTTLERNYLMSHFDVHFSPVYYLLLPFYMIFRRPEFLLGAQAAVCFSGVVPVLLLCKKQKYSALTTICICGAFLCYPAFTGGCFYDFHENFFLVPFILWLLYFIEKNNFLGTVIFGLLMLTVKEDAGLYVIFIALYALFNKKIKRSISISLIILGIGGFAAVTYFINAAGEGIKVSRYGNYLYAGQDSLTDVVINVIKNPAFFLKSLLDEQKLLFVMQMLLPLLFIPVRTRKLSDWFLIAPMLLVNLATEYQYQSNISFQYVFGTGALLIFLFIKNLRYSKQKNKAAAAAFMAAVICMLSNSMPKYRYGDRYVHEPDIYNDTIAVLQELPRDKIIFSNTYFTPFLYDCKKVYMYSNPFTYKPEVEAPDYYLIDKRSNSENLEKELTSIKEKGYEIETEKGYIIVLKKSE